METSFYNINNTNNINSMFLLFGVNQLPLINTIQNASLHILSKEPKELTRFRVPRVRGSTIMLRFIIILAVFILFLTFYLVGMEYFIILSRYFS
jgi:hypothetical protein